MEYSQNSADMAKEFAWIAVAIQSMDGVSEYYDDFLEGA